MMNTNEQYLGSIHVSSATDEARIRRLEASGATVLRSGSLAQVFGNSELRGLFQGVAKKAFRGELWHGSPRDTAHLHLDAQYVVKLLVPLLQEEIHTLQDPTIVMNGLRQIGHGTSLEVLNRYHNTKLDIHVSANGWDRENWLRWRLTAWTPETREIYEEKAVPYPETAEFDEYDERLKVAKAILTHCKKWLKDSQ